jgi:hypothetical protein
MGELHAIGHDCFSISMSCTSSILNFITRLLGSTLGQPSVQLSLVRDFIALGARQNQMAIGTSDAIPIQEGTRQWTPSSLRPPLAFAAAVCAPRSNWKVA